MRFSILCAALLLAACQGKPSAPPAPPAETGKAAAATGDIDPAYRSDFENLCHAEERSGADEQPGQRSVTIAMWLGSAIRTDRGRQFLANLSRTAPDDKAALLDAERKRLGVADCPLIKAWQG